MQNFKTVISQTCDLIDYWAATQSRAELRSWFKHCVGKGGTAPANWKSKREPYKATGATLFFYPHRKLDVHHSLGAKHGVYPKLGFKRKGERYHVDVLAVTEAVYLGDGPVYRNGAWVVTQDGR